VTRPTHVRIGEAPKTELLDCSAVWFDTRFGDAVGLDIYVRCSETWMEARRLRGRSPYDTVDFWLGDDKFTLELCDALGESELTNERGKARLFGYMQKSDRDRLLSILKRRERA
jgi:hypothetical protein